MKGISFIHTKGHKSEQASTNRTLKGLRVHSFYTNPKQSPT